MFYGYGFICLLIDGSGLLDVVVIVVVTSEVVEVEDIIGGVEARKIILKKLLDGPKSGVELRHALAVAFNRPVTEISDAMLYFNLQALENAGLIRRNRGRDNWKAKFAEIVPEKIQLVRKYFGISVPIVCIGGLDDPQHVRGMRRVLRSDNNLVPSKYIFVISSNFKRKIAGVPEDVVFEEFEEHILEEDFEEVYRKIRGIIEKEVATHEVILDLTCGSRVCILSLFKIAWEFGLRCFYVQRLGENEKRVIWIKS